MLKYKVLENSFGIALIVLIISYLPFNVMGVMGSDSFFVLFRIIDVNSDSDDPDWKFSPGNGSIWLIKTDEEGDIEWDQVYGGKDADMAYSLIQTTDGGFAFAGITLYNDPSPADHLSDMWLIKTDEKGLMQRNQTYGEVKFDDDFGCALIQTRDEGFTLASGKNWDMWLVKTDRNGSIQWDKVYGGIKNDAATTLIQTTDGGFALVGTTSSYGAGGDDIWLVKTNTSGEIQWQKTYGSIYDDSASTLLQTDEGDLVLAGNVASSSPHLSTYLVKTNSSGVMKWNQTYDISNLSINYALIQTTDNGFGLAGWIHTSTSYNGQMWFMKTDNNGTAQWNQTYGGMKGEVAYDLIQTTEGGFALAGSTSSFSTGRQDMWLVKTDKNGYIQWNRSYGGTQKDYARVLLQTTDGGFVLLGTTESFGINDEKSTPFSLLGLFIFIAICLLSQKRKIKPPKNPPRMLR